MGGALAIKTAFLGRVPYERAYELQKALLEEISGETTGRITGCVLFLEHDPVITLGRSGAWEHLLKPLREIEKSGITVLETDRGGDITAHYPGQLITYPIMPLEAAGRNIHAYLRMLEETGIKAAAHYGIRAARRKGLTGVWVGRRKIMAVGLGFRRWVSYHGSAFNVWKDGGIFDLVVPCGLHGEGVTSVEELTGAAPPLAEAAAIMRECFEAVFDVETMETPAEEIWAAATRAGL
ncbi:MAG TPA: lipoyl(octanoyl) transferase [Planctomycetes bacterium]|nr:lipoyl(octanoyl) transferase [Planctomycetota bacterium]